jgi:hypothetical protein
MCVDTLHKGEKDDDKEIIIIIIIIIITITKTTTICIRHPVSIPDLKQQIWQCNETIPNNLLQCVMASLPD